MTRSLMNHLRGNAVAYVALFVALGGTSYAAIRIGNQSLTPVKLNSRYFGGYVREWASVAADGRVIRATVRVRVGTQATTPGDYLITWLTKPTRQCAALVSVDATGLSGVPIPGYAVEESTRPGRGDERSIVQTYDSAGATAALPFDVELVCMTPR